MSRIPNPPRITISISIYEILALCSMLKLGKLFTRAKELKQVEAVLARIDKKLSALGLARDVVDKLVKL